MNITKVSAFGLTLDFDFDLGVMTERRSGLRFQFDTHETVYTPKGVAPAVKLSHKKSPWCDEPTSASWEFSIGYPEAMFLYATGLDGFSARAQGATTSQGWRWEEGNAVHVG